MKRWKTPMVTTVSAGQLSKYIKAAARSGMCWGGDFR